MLCSWPHKIFAADPKQMPALDRAYPGIGCARISTPPIFRAKLWVIVAVAAAFSAVCRAQNNCPWLNVATASGVLGDSAALTVNKTGEDSGTCVFRTQSGSSAESLTISVASVADPQNAEQNLRDSESRCTSSATPLKAIGNDAVLCANNATTSHGEQVIGRVRYSIFIVSISAEAAPSRGAVSDSLAEKVKAIAEQVAGNLF